LGGSGDLTSVLRTYPELSPELPQVVEQFFMRVAIPFPSGRVGVIVESVQEEPSGDLALGLDIQAVVQREFSPESEELWSEFDELRSIKNKCFFESLKQSKWEEYL